MSVMDWEAFYDNRVRSHPHHVISKKSGGDDVATNLCPLCPLHHREIHNQGIRAMCEKYPVVKNWMVANGHFAEE